ncbi:hypothetical protein DFH07DRAFT_765024 [Mycena maculata]|uniref:Uncharacterized protein n=1 Tax=Mycena maculata TaxID=230809 RepID=A0AAD7KFG9_9AGAR|nr:hypothetical protein DFH07DRAFT_765024 [Mycena maculata]
MYQTNFASDFARKARYPHGGSTFSDAIDPKDCPGRRARSRRRAPTYYASLASAASTSTADAKRAAPATPRARSSITIATKSSPVATSWFNFASPAAQQVRTTVKALLRDCVKSQHPDMAIEILKSCASACSANNLSLSSVLQEKSVEGHTPLYWVIIKRPAESAAEDRQNIDLLTALLGLSTPLTPATISDVRLACLLMSDQVLFQRLRTSPEFAPMNTTDEMLLDATMPPDDIVVEDVASVLETRAIIQRSVELYLFENLGVVSDYTSETVQLILNGTRDAVAYELLLQVRRDASTCKT